MEMTGGIGADAALECVGTAQAMATAFAPARPGSTVGMVGVPHGDVPVAQAFFRNVGWQGGHGTSPYLHSELLDEVLDGSIKFMSYLTTRLTWATWPTLTPPWTSAGPSSPSFGWMPLWSGFEPAMSSARSRAARRNCGLGLAARMDHCGLSQPCGSSSPGMTCTSGPQAAEDGHGPCRGRQPGGPGVEQEESTLRSSSRPQRPDGAFITGSDLPHDGGVTAFLLLGELRARVMAGRAPTPSTAVKVRRRRTLWTSLVT